jgi:SAM-dependent methyltransferase
VADVACGTGYGADILLDTGSDGVLAVDLSAEALSGASRSPGKWLVRANALQLPLPDASFQALTSFETLEHVEQQEHLVSEFARILAQDGILVLSTPNADVTRPINGVPRNPFHVHEFVPVELHDLLSRHFSEVTMYGQHVHERFPRMPLLGPAEFDADWRATTWRAVHRMVPFGAKDRLARLRKNRGFYPSEFDYVFRERDLAHAHVLVAVCKR